MRIASRPILQTLTSLMLVMLFSVQSFAGAFSCHTNVHAHATDEMLMSHDMHAIHMSSSTNEEQSLTQTSNDQNCCQNHCDHNLLHCKCHVATSTLLLDIPMQIISSMTVAQAPAFVVATLPNLILNSPFRPPRNL